MAPVMMRRKPYFQVSKPLRAFKCLQQYFSGTLLTIADKQNAKRPGSMHQSCTVTKPNLERGSRPNSISVESFSYKYKPYKAFTCGNDLARTMSVSPTVPIYSEASSKQYHISFVHECRINITRSNERLEPRRLTALLGGYVPWGCSV